MRNLHVEDIRNSHSFIGSSSGSPRLEDAKGDDAKQENNKVDESSDSAFEMVKQGEVRDQDMMTSNRLTTRE